MTRSGFAKAGDLMKFEHASHRHLAAGHRPALHREALGAVGFGRNPDFGMWVKSERFCLGAVLRCGRMKADRLKIEVQARRIQDASQLSNRAQLRLEVLEPKIFLDEDEPVRFHTSMITGRVTQTSRAPGRVCVLFNQYGKAS